MKNFNLYRLLLAIGPGIFAIGYTIGTGSVTSMIVAGSKYGMQLLWVLLLSCFFSWVLMEAYGRYALVTGQTALFGFKKNLKYGKIISILIIIGITIGQWNSLIGILGISANAIFETLAIFFPWLKDNQYLAVLLLAIVIIGIMYLLLLQGTYSIFERVLIFFVTLMGLSFVMSFFMVLPQPSEIVKGLLPSIPQVKGGKMLVAAFVGTTMASATFLSRPLFLQGKGWNKDNLKDQSRDAATAAILIFCISGAIMAVAMGAFFHKGIAVTRVLDMVNTLEPIAGKMAVSVFLLGTLSAGLSSIFPILMIAPMLIADYQSGVLDTKSKQFKILTLIACIIGLTVPVFGANPINAQILSQVFNVFVLPLVVLGIFLLVNNQALMGTNKAGFKLNTGIVGAFIFSILISYNGVIGIINNF